MKSRHLKGIIALSAVAILGITLILYHAYQGAVDSTKEKFNAEQSVLAKQLGIALQKDIQILVKELEFLSHLETDSNLETVHMRAFLEEIYNHELQTHSVNDVALLDSNGIIRYAVNAPYLEGKDFSFRQYYQMARELRTTEPVYEYVEFKGVDAGKKGIIIAMPTFTYGERFNGLILFTIKCHDLIEHLIPPETYGSTFWVFDGSGNILFHPEQPPGTNVASLVGENGSFNAFIEEIRGRDEYQAEYISPRDGAVIASSHTIRISGEPWTIVVSMPVNNFAGIIDHSSKEYAFGILLITITGMGFIALILDYNKALRKSHDELELRVEERTAALARAKAIAEEERAKSQAIVSGIGDGISVQTPDFQIMYQNETHKQMVGDHGGKYCYEAYQGKDRVCEGCPLTMAFEDGGIHRSERSTVRDGKILHVDITASTLRNSEGEIIGGIEIVRDITRRKLAAEALRKTEEELRTIYNAISGHLTVVDKNYRIVTYNNTVEKQFGKDLKGKLCYETYQGRNEICPDCAVQKTLKTGMPSFTFQPETPSSKPVEIYAYPIFDEKGQVAAVVEHGIEVTEKVKMEEALRKSEERYRDLLELAQEGIWVIDKDAITTFVNSSMASMLGYSVDEMIGHHLFEFMDDEAIEIAKQNLERRREGIKEQHDFILMRKDGSQITTTMETSPILDENGDYNGAIAGVIDTTDRKRVEDNLKEAYSHLETLIEAMPYAVFFKDADGRHVVLNEACCKFSGHTKEECLGKTCFDLLPPDLAEKCHKSDEEIMKKGKTICIDEQTTDGDGNKLFIETIKTPIFDENGKVKGLIGLFHDITDRKRTEEELIRSRNLLSMLDKARELYILKSSRDEVFTKLLDTIVLFTESEYGFINQVLVDGNGERYMQTLALSNISWDDDSHLLYEQIKKRGFEFRNLNSLQATPAATGKLVISNDRANDSRSGDLPQGHPPINNFMGIPMYFGGELVGVAGVANRDGGYDEQMAVFLEPFISSCASIITAFRNEDVKKFLHEEALRASQLASVGELAAGVAHEINNPINGIINYAQILLNRSAQDENKDIASRIVKEGDRISNIVRSLLSFARADGDIRLDVSIDELLKDVLSLTGTQLRKEGIILETRIPPELPAVKVNRQQMEQVFLNIINNSQYALNQKYPGADPDKTLTITACKYDHLGIPHVRVIITDKGTGIPTHLINKVTTTFFTTKPKGKGTGLGLSICQNIVNDHGGVFSIDSKEGEFTTVNVDIPSAEITATDKDHKKRRKRKG